VPVEANRSFKVEHDSCCTPSRQTQSCASSGFEDAFCVTSTRLYTRPFA
jgi:hypothetical protein